MCRQFEPAPDHHPQWRSHFEILLSLLTLIVSRNTNIDLDSFIKLDIKNRDLIQKKEKLEQEKKIISKKQDKKQFSRSKKISTAIDKLVKSQSKINFEVIVSKLNLKFSTSSLSIIFSRTRDLSKFSAKKACLANIEKGINP